MLNRLLIILIGIAFVGCSGGHETTDSVVEEETYAEVKETSQEPKIDVTTEVRHAYIKEFTNYNSENYLVVDYADFFEGEEAGEMEWRDKAYFVEDGETITNITDGYYISNMNNKLRTFRLREDVDIRVWTNLEGYELYNDLTKVSLQVLQETVVKYNILWVLTIEKGVVISIEEQFRP